MKNQGRKIGLLTLGGLLGLCLAGCKQSTSFVQTAATAFPMQTNPESAVQLLQPRPRARGQSPSVYIPPAPNRSIPRQAVVSILAPVKRVKTSQVGGEEASSTSSSAWRPLQRAEPVVSHRPTRQTVVVSKPLSPYGGTAKRARAWLAMRPRAGMASVFRPRGRTTMVALADDNKDDKTSKTRTLPPPTRDVPKIPPPISRNPVVTAPGRAPSHPYHHQWGTPREGHKKALPPYVIEPPDILLVELSRKLPETEQPVGGQHLVRPDGTISLGVYGSVYVAGLTLEQARRAVHTVLRRTIKGSKDDPFEAKEVYVDVLAYNSKVYYVITDGGGSGEQVYRIPATGNETILDAISQINGLPAVASKKRIWLARSNAGRHQGPQVLPIDWRSVTQHANPYTNYQVYPGDRIYIASDPKIRVDTFLAKVLSPIERLLGTVLLGSSTVNSISGRGNFGGGGGAFR